MFYVSPNLLSVKYFITEGVGTSATLSSYKEMNIKSLRAAVYPKMNIAAAASRQ